MPNSAPSSFHTLLRAVAGPFAVAFGLTVLLWLATGATLGLFFGGLFLAVLLIAFIALPETDLQTRLLRAAGVADAVGLVWLIAVLINGQLSIRQWLACYLILLAVLLLQLGIAARFRRVRLTPLSSASASLFVTLLWLTSPIWLLHHLQTPALLPVMHRLIAIHPLFAINSAIPAVIWTESPIAYRLMNLNQDVPYALPGSAIPCVLLHTVAGLILLAVGRTRRSR